MNSKLLHKFKIFHWIILIIAFIINLSAIPYLLFVNWSVHTLFVLIFLGIACVLIDKILEFILLKKIYKNKREFSVQNLFRKGVAINPNNQKGKLLWLFNIVPLTILSVFIGLLSIIFKY